LKEGGAACAERNIRIWRRDFGKSAWMEPHQIAKRLYAPASFRPQIVADF